MPNRAYLALTQSGDPNDEPTAATILVAASACYPVLWWNIFARDDITVRTDQWEDDDGNPVPVEVPTLITTKEKAISRALARRRLFYSYFPTKVEQYYHQWTALLEGVDAPFIQLFTDEIAAMSEPIRLPPDIDRYEREFQRVETFVRAFTYEAIDDWVKLLGQVQIKLHRETRALTYVEGEFKDGYREYVYRELSEREIDEVIGYRLRGYSWERPVPWDED